MSDEIDFWKDAGEFFKKRFSEGFKEDLEKFVLDKQYGENDFRLFKSMLESRVGLEATVVFLKMDFTKNNKT